MSHWRKPHADGPIRSHLGPALAILFAVVIIVVAGIMSGPDDCPRGSVTASGIARCR